MAGWLKFVSLKVWAYRLQQLCNNGVSVVPVDMNAVPCVVRRIKWGFNNCRARCRQDVLVWGSSMRYIDRVETEATYRGYSRKRH